MCSQIPAEVNPEEQAPGVLGWVDGAERAALGWQRPAALGTAVQLASVSNCPTGCTLLGIQVSGAWVLRF